MPEKPKAHEYKLAHEADNHFVIQHPDGSHFKVAKKGLDERTVAKIQAMADGGEVQDPAAAVGIDPSLLAPAGSATPDAPVTREPQGVDLANLIQSGVDAVKTGFNRSMQPIPGSLGHEMPTPSAGDAGVPGQLVATGASKPLASTDGTMVTPDPSAGTGYGSSVGVPQAPAASKADPNDPMALYQKAFAQQRAGAQQEAAAKTQQGDEIADAMQRAAKAQEDLQKLTSSHEIDLAKERADLEKDYRTNVINPNRVYQNMGTGNRILAAISLALGGLAGGLNKTGSNAAMDVINNAISRDIDAQKANMDKQKNLLSFNYQKTKDMREAALLTQNQLLSAAKIQAEMAGAKAQGPLAQAALQSTLGAINGQQAQIEMQLAQMRAKASLTNGGGVPLTPFLASDKDIASRVVPTNIDVNGRPLYHLAGSEKSAETQKMVENDSRSVLENIAQLKKLAGDSSAAISPEKRALFDNLKQQVAAQLGTLSGVNRYNTDEANQNKDTLGKLGLGQATGSTLARLNQAQDFITRLRENSRQVHLLNYKSPARISSARPHVAQR